MRFEMLGPVRVIDHDGASSLTARKIEILLVVLLARADQVTTTGQLMTEIWGENPPRRATASLHVYVSQLRKFLDRPGRETGPIITRPPGYLLRLGDDELDVHDFQRLVQQGRCAVQQGRPEEAAPAFERALALWRGATLGDLRDGPIIYSYVTWLEELRLECLEMLIDVYLWLGRHREIIGRLYTLTEEHPLHEAFYRQLMLALYRADRQADALGAYRTARERLNRELGLEPCRSLRDLHESILRGGERLLGAPELARAAV
ncbi:AfsR/SARP family transcriptional regulator [Actinomadura litoris]|uniref:AfsR/SARP family transcriptional regulator n=1 Tax=Actinomadura litoris TaxID=2678616 RepID=UPI001FA7F633|nr:AfsR/SARP family transcriptional regulator [Actinomadura litoris]